jgi:hypothetical protein
MRIRILVCIIAILVIVPGTSFSGGKNSSKSSGQSDYLKQDSIFKDRTNIYERDGILKGHIKQDLLLDGRQNI